MIEEMTSRQGMKGSENGMRVINLTKEKKINRAKRAIAQQAVCSFCKGRCLAGHGNVGTGMIVVAYVPA